MTDTTGRRGNRGATNSEPGTRTRRTDIPRRPRTATTSLTVDPRFAAIDARFNTVDLAILALTQQGRSSGDTVSFTAVDERVTSLGMRITTMVDSLGERINVVERALAEAQRTRGNRERVFVTALIESGLTEFEIAEVLVDMSDPDNPDGSFDFDDNQLVLGIVRTISLIREQIAKHTRRLDAHDDHFVTVEHDLNELRTDVTDHGTRLDTVETRVDDVRRDLDEQRVYCDDEIDASDARTRKMFRSIRITNTSSFGHGAWIGPVVGIIVWLFCWKILGHPYKVVDKAGKQNGTFEMPWFWLGVIFGLIIGGLVTLFFQKWASKASYMPENRPVREADIDDDADDDITPVGAWTSESWVDAPADNRSVVVD